MQIFKLGVSRYNNRISTQFFHHSCVQFANPAPPTKKAKSDWKRRQDGSNFLDTLNMVVESGRGGNGAVSFHREKFKAKGPPSGGKGGEGGSVYLVATPALTSFSHLPRLLRADSGSPGGSSWLVGKRGEDLFIKVPVGTIVKEFYSDGDENVELNEQKEELQRLKLALSGSRIRLDEALNRDKEWDKWKAHRDAQEKLGIKEPPFEEVELYDIGKHKEEALKWARQELFITYPLTDLKTHPAFLQSEVNLLSKLVTQRERLILQKQEPLVIPLYTPTPMTDPILLLRGGAPGLGNPAFHTPTDRSPKYGTRGARGRRMRIELELMMSGDVGLVGFPNVGKSTLLTALTSATPKIASYAFTTLNPQLGTCVLHSSKFTTHKTSVHETGNKPETFDGSRVQATKYRDESLEPKFESQRFTVMDIPGLLPEASQNVGLGHAFLRHLLRCRTLVFIVDLSWKITESDRELVDPIACLNVLKQELVDYEAVRELESGILTNKIQGIVVNKADVATSPEEIEQAKAALQNIHKWGRDYRPDAPLWVVPTSAKNTQNLEMLVEKMAQGVEEARKIPLEMQART